MKRKVTISLVVFVIAVALFSFFFVYLPYTRIRAKANVVVASAKELKTAFSANDIDLVKTKLDDFSAKYADLEKESKSVYWMAFVPYVSDYKNGITAGRYLIHAGQQAVVAVAPVADLIGFKKGQSSFVEKSAEDRLKTAVLTLDQVLSKIDPISSDIDEAEKLISKIDPNRYPEKVGKTEVKSQIITLKQSFSSVSSLFVGAKPFLKKLPVILGKDKEQTYLMLSQNDKERRATGGFLTAYAIFKIKDGKITIEKSEDIYTLDNSIANHPVAPEKILTYHKGVSQFYIRDSNLSPDLPTSVNLFNSLYDKSNERIKYDGIVMIDSHILVDMLRIYGDTEVDGVRFSANTDKRCDCPQVIYALSDIVDRPVNYIKTNRKGILGDLMYTLFYKALGFSPRQYWPELIQTMFKNMDEKHMQLYFVDSEVQKAVENLNYAGRIRDYDGDYLDITNVNFAGAKANLFVSETVTSETKTAGGKTTRNVTVEYRNPYPASDCNLERGGLCLNAPLRNWVRLYVPKGSQLVQFNGSEKKVQTYDELGKTVFEGFLTVNPLGKAEINVEYTLPSGLKTDPYKILIQKQAGVDSQKLKVQYNGSTLFNGDLVKDIEVKQ